MDEKELKGLHCRVDCRLYEGTESDDWCVQHDSCQLGELRNIALQALRRAEPWQPIESAPKDGTKIIVAKFGKNEVGKDLGFWWASGATWREGLYQHAWHDGTEWLVTPTHWQPITPPEASDD